MHIPDIAQILETACVSYPVSVVFYDLLFRSSPHRVDARDSSHMFGLSQGYIIIS